MSTFPTALDSIPDVTDGVDYPEATHINTLNDAVENIEEKIGIDDSAVSTSLDYKLTNTTNGHDHDGSDSKKVIATNLNSTGLTASQLLRVNSSGTAIESSGKTIPTGTIVGDSDSQTLTSKTLTSPVINTSVSGTAFLDEDNMASNSATKFCSQQSIKAYVDSATTTASNAWPIGSVFISVVSTNPNTLLGFGTWSAFGSGRVLVGRDSGDTDFDVAEEIGGSKTVSIAHTHTGPSHTHIYSGTSGSATDADLKRRGTTDPQEITRSVHTHDYSGTTNTGGTGNTGAMSANATPSVVQPYIVVYMWKRTA